MRSSLVFFVCLSLTGCVTERATHFRVPRERAAECVSNCAELDMKLSAVVIIKSAAGCVCQPKDAPPASAEQSATLIGAGAAVAEEEARTQRDQEQRSQQEDTRRRESQRTSPKAF